MADIASPRNLRALADRSDDPVVVEALRAAAQRLSEVTGRIDEFGSAGEVRFASHHTAISVRDLDATISFYGVFGFQLVVRWDAPDGSLRIAHLALPDGRILEAFHYTVNTSLSALDVEVGNDLEALGVKHLGLRVRGLLDTHQRLLERWPQRTAPIQHGRTGIDYFFVRDPDGLWLEIVQDDRALDPRRPLHLP